MKRKIIQLTAMLAVLVPGTSALAIPTFVQHVDHTDCDTLLVPVFVHELGINGAPGHFFPPDETIDAFSLTTNVAACTADDPAVPNAEVRMYNATGIDWAEVWYVADPETSISNFDGFVNGMPAFKIDSVGLNRPLIGESILADGIWQNGELWTFVIDDYFNTLGLPAHAFFSVGVPTAGDTISSGSIIAHAVPEPASLSMLFLAALELPRRRRI